MSAMTLNRALTRRTILSDILRDTGKYYIGAVQGVAKKVVHPAQAASHTQDQFTAVLKSNYDEMISYLNEFIQLSKNIASVNAGVNPVGADQFQVSIPKLMFNDTGKATVAELLAYKKLFSAGGAVPLMISSMKAQLASVLTVQQRSSEALEKAINDAVQLDGTNLTTSAELESLRANITKTKTDSFKVELLDPLNLKDRIAELEQTVQFVTQELDICLSEFNATTVIPG